QSKEEELQIRSIPHQKPSRIRPQCPQEVPFRRRRKASASPFYPPRPSFSLPSLFSHRSPFDFPGSYMAVKNRKLREQFDAGASSSGKGIFSGISIFVDGFTVPPSQVLSFFFSVQRFAGLSSHLVKFALELPCHT
ncbi:hypothetical protein BHE74_00007179, partial [Ensete ventricosum]